MDYLNARLGFLRNMLPDGYAASSITDFLKSRKNIPVPKTWGVINSLLKGMPRDSVEVDFPDVQLNSFEISGIRAGWTLSDGHRELYLYPLHLELAPREMGKYPDGHYKKVRAAYVLAFDRLHLVRAMNPERAGQGSKANADLERRIRLGETVLVADRK